MPNRIIKESICTSENLASLSAEAERLFYRLMVQCDDYGLMMANPSVVRSRCFQLTSDTIKEKQMISWLSELESAGLIFFYEVDGKRYLKYTKWECHQQRRSMNSKYPLPERGSEVLIADDIRCNQMISDDSNGNQMIAYVPESSNREANTRVVIEKRIRTREDGKLTLAPLVRMTAEEHQSLKDQHGEDAAAWMIQRLSDYKTASGKSYKSDAAAIRTWVAGAWEDEKRRRGTNKPNEPLPDYLKKGAPWPDASK